MNNISTALILAAGLGVRMGPAGQVLPKGFIDIDGIALVRRSIDQLLAHRITSIVIVTGHLHSFYDALPEDYAGQITCVHNKHFDSSGSFESLVLGLTRVNQPCLLLESDIIYEDRGLELLLQHSAESAILVSGPTGAGDEVHVWAKESPGSMGMRVNLISKNRHEFSREPYGELVGISKVGVDLRARIVARAATMRALSPRIDYELGLIAIADGLAIDCIRIADLVWGEIDDPAMLDRVRREVLPRLVAPRRHRKAFAN